MAKLQQKTSLCKQNISCTCKSYEELKILKNVIYKAAKNCELTICEKEIDSPYLLIERLRKNIKGWQSVINSYERIIKGLEPDIKFWQDSSRYWRNCYEDAEILRKIAESQCTDKNKPEAPTECKVRHLRVV